MLKKTSLYFIIVFFSLVVSLIVGEIYFILNDKEKLNKTQSNKKNKLLYDENLGWIQNHNMILKIYGNEFGNFTQITNNLGLNNLIDFDDKTSHENKVLVLGDSHTQSTGVATKKIWTEIVNKKFGYKKKYILFNTASGGYNLDQYYFSLIKYIDIIKPNLVILGFTSATDFYDVGRFNEQFISGKKTGRSYFKLSGNNLTIDKSLQGEKNITVSENNNENNYGNKKYIQIIKNNLNKLYIYRNLKGTKIGYFLVSKFRSENYSIWPGMEMALKIKLNNLEREKLKLIDRILSLINEECNKRNIDLIILHLPYIVETYPDIWEYTYKSNPNFSIDGGEKKLINLTNKHNIRFIKTRKIMEKEFLNTKKRLHFMRDGHMNNDGHIVIGRIVSNYLEKNYP